jgi:hypothetical protein
MRTSANHGFPRVSPGRPLGPALLGAALLFAACGDLAGPAGGGPANTPPLADTAAVLPSTNVYRSDLEPAGTVVETADGYTVSGSLAMRTSDTTTITFLDANVRVRFDENDRVTSISGRELPERDRHGHRHGRHRR